MDAVVTDRFEDAAGISDAMEHVLAAAGQRCAAEPECLLDLDGRGELAALRIVADTAHFLVEGAAEVRHARAALSRRREERRRDQLRVLRAELIFRVELLLEGELVATGVAGERR